MDLLGLIPFCAMTTSGHQPKMPSLSLQRILESLVIAAITAVVTMYGTVNAMSIQTQSMATQVQEMRIAVTTLSEKIVQGEIIRASLTAQRTAEIAAVVKQNIDQEERLRRLENVLRNR